MRDIRQEAQEELERGIAFLQEIENHRRGNVEGFIATDEFGNPYTQYVAETPYVKREIRVLPRSMGKTVSILDEVFVMGRQFGKNIPPFSLMGTAGCFGPYITVVADDKTYIVSLPINEVPSELRGRLTEIEFFDDEFVEVSELSRVKMPAGKLGDKLTKTISSLLNITGAKSFYLHGGRSEDSDLLFQMTEIEYSEGSYREPTLDSFSQLRPGYRGGNTPNLFKSCNPCSKVNPKDVAKRRAKNKAARKTKRK